MARTTQHEPGCRCTVPLEEVGGVFGLPPGSTRTLVEHFGFSVVEDWAERWAMPVGDVAEFATAYRRDRDALDAKNDAYRRYLADRERKAQADRIEAIEKARTESKAKNRKLIESERDRVARHAAEEAAGRHAEEAQRRGNPVSFEDFDG